MSVIGDVVDSLKRFFNFSFFSDKSSLGVCFILLGCLFSLTGFVFLFAILIFLLYKRSSFDFELPLLPDPLLEGSSSPLSSANNILVRRLY